MAVQTTKYGNGTGKIDERSPLAPARMFVVLEKATGRANGPFYERKLATDFADTRWGSLWSRKAQLVPIDPPAL